MTVDVKDISIELMPSFQTGKLFKEMNTAVNKPKDIGQ
jgi:hypothetical protein